MYIHSMDILYEVMSLDYIQYPYCNVHNSDCIFACVCFSKMVEANLQTNMLKKNHTAVFFYALADRP